MLNPTDQKVDVMRGEWNPGITCFDCPSGKSRQSFTACQCACTPQLLGQHEAVSSTPARARSVAGRRYASIAVKGIVCKVCGGVSICPHNTTRAA